MKNLFLLLPFLLLCCLSCQKDEPIDLRPPCEIDNWGHVNLVNAGNKTWGVIINGTNEGILEARDNLYLTSYPAGNVSITLESIFTNESVTTQKVIEQCGETVFTMQ